MVSLHGSTSWKYSCLKALFHATLVINILLGLSIRTPKTINFLFVPNRKLMVLGVPKFKHVRVLSVSEYLRHTDDHIEEIAKCKTVMEDDPGQPLNICR